MKKRPIAIDLFSGCGGMSLGLEAAGFDIALAVEFDAIHALVHHFNFPYAETICKDISCVTKDEILARLESWGDEKEVDLIVGGPPCQGFSHIGKRQLSDPRNYLVYQYIRIVLEIRPKYFIFENVPGIATGKHKEFLEEVIFEFEKNGYSFAQPFQIMDASHFGAPQKRNRLILLGSREDMPLVSYPKPTHQNKDALAQDFFLSPYVTVKESIFDLERFAAFTEVDEGIDICDGHYMGGLEKYALTPSDTYSLCHQRKIEKKIYGHLGSTHTQTSSQRFAATTPNSVEPISRFFKLSPEGLCNTLRAGTNSDKGAYTAARPIHYSLPRCITIREAARLHTFPDWFQFHRTIWHGFREIGNSVIPLLSFQLGKSIIRAMKIDTSNLEIRQLEQVDPELLSYPMSKACSFWGIQDNVIPKRKRLA